MKKIIRLTESDLARIVKRVIKEEVEMTKIFEQEKNWLIKNGWKLIDTEKYKLYAEKEDNTTTTVPLKLIITSQSNGTLVLSVYNKNKMESNNIHSIRQLDPVTKNIQNDITLEKCETWMD